MTEPKRHALLLFAYKNPHQVHRAIHALRHPQVDIFLHVDKKFAASPFLHPNAILVTPRVHITWADYGTVQATLNWLRMARTRKSYATYSLLSAQDYPLLRMEELVAALDLQSEERISTALKTDFEARRYRFEEFHVVTTAFWPRVFGRIQRKLHSLKNQPRRLPAGLKFSAGSAFWTLTGPMVHWMLDFLSQHPEVEPFFRHTWDPDEMFFQILVEASPFRDRLAESAHFIDWSAGGAHPKTFDSSDFERLRDSGKLYARKFDTAVDEAILDRIDTEILGRSSRS